MNATLTAEQLDEVYTQACRAMTDLGEARGELFLARLALLLMKEVGAADRIAVAIDTARRSVEAG